MKPLTQLIIALIATGVVFSGYVVWYRVVGAQSASVAELTAKIESASAAEGRAAAARVALEDLSKDETDIAQYFVSTDSLVAFLEDLQARASRAGASASVASVSANKDTKHPAVDVTLQLTGSFSAVMLAAGRIEYAPYDIRVVSFSANASVADTTGKAEWIGAMVISVGSSPATTSRAATPAASTSALLPAATTTPTGSSATTTVTPHAI